MTDISFIYHVLVSMALFISFALILKDMRGVFWPVIFIGFIKELTDPVFSMSDMAGDFLGAALAYLFVLFLLDNIGR